MSQVPGRVRAREVVVGDPVEVGNRRVHVGARTDGGDGKEPVGRDPEVVGRPPVPRSRARVPRVERVGAVRGVVEHVAEAEVAVVDELGGDALTIHLGQAEVRVVEPVVPVGVRVLDLGQARAAALRGEQEDRGRVDLVVLAQAG